MIFVLVALVNDKCYLCSFTVKAFTVDFDKRLFDIPICVDKMVQCYISFSEVNIWRLALIQIQDTDWFWPEFTHNIYTNSDLISILVVNIK